MSREERSILQQLIFTYLIGEMEMGPIPAQKKVESMTDEEIERFFEQPKRSTLERQPWNGRPALMMADQKGKYMKKLYMVKKGNRKFYVCKWDSGLYSIERITKGFGGSVIFKDTLEEIERYAEENGYKKVA